MSEHWSSPNGCADGCPACDAELTTEERAKEKAQQRLEMAAPALLAACKLALQHTITCDEIPKRVDKALQAAIKLAEKP